MKLLTVTKHSTVVRQHKEGFGMGMTATEEALLRALWGALEAQDVHVRDYDDFTQIDGSLERGQLAFNIIARLSAEGLVLVPKELSDELVEIGYHAFAFERVGDPVFTNGERLRKAWAAMLAASPHHLHPQQSNKPEAGEEG